MPTPQQVARAIHRLLSEQPEGAWTIEELARDASTSKTGALRALRELEDAGLISVSEEEP